MNKNVPPANPTKFGKIKLMMQQPSKWLMLWIWLRALTGAAYMLFFVLQTESLHMQSSFFPLDMFNGKVVK